mgnify:CR=1 FL=1
MKEKCGLFGIYSKKPYKNCIKEVINGLNLLQHRGQEGCGISYNISGIPIVKKGIGLVKDVFNEYSTNNYTNMCIGHVRYSTSGEKNKYGDTQPLYGKTNIGDFYLAHNGNIPNIEGHDTKYLISFLENNTYDNWNERLINLIETIPCAYCLLILTDTEIYIIRDRFGIRPLCLGYYNDDFCISSESSALHKFNHLRDVSPGEICKLSNNGLERVYLSKRSKLCICAFEFIYFLKPNSFTDGYIVEDVRKNLGITLAKKEDLLLDPSFKVVGIPNSGIISAKSYSEFLKLDYKQFITKNKNVNRTFILSTNEERQKACKEKFIFSKNISGYKIIVIDDTIVRGNVMTSIVHKLWEMGAIEIHIRIPAPPVISKCQFGIDIPNEQELLVTNRNNEQIKNLLNVTSIRYLNCKDLDNIIPKDSYKECFSGEMDNDITLLPFY